MSPLELLLRVQSRDSTGQLFVVTYDGRQIRVGVEAGKIVHVGYGPRRGKAAAELASNAVAKSATFRADPDVMRDEDLPNERVLLGLLSRMLSGSNADALSSVLSGDVFDWCMFWSCRLRCCGPFEGENDISDFNFLALLYANFFDNAAD